MARHRLLPLAAAALTGALTLLTGCGSDSSPASSASSPSPSAPAPEGGDGPVVVATTTWEGAFAVAAGAEDVTVIVPQSVHHAPDYDPKPSDLTAVAAADFVLYAPFEPYAAQIKDAAGSDAELVEVDLANDADRVRAEVARLGQLFGTEAAARTWTEEFDTAYAGLAERLATARPGGEPPTAIAQVFTSWAADLAGLNTVATYGPESVTPQQLAEFSGLGPALVLDNAHMSTGDVLPYSGARQVDIVNYPGDDLDLLAVYRDAAAAVEQALAEGE